MKKILIGSYDLEVGGVERSLISMLNNFDYKILENNLDALSITKRRKSDIKDMIDKLKKLL